MAGCGAQRVTGAAGAPLGSVVSAALLGIRAWCGATLRARWSGERATSGLCCRTDRSAPQANGPLAGGQMDVSAPPPAILGGVLWGTESTCESPPGTTGVGVCPPLCRVDSPQGLQRLSDLFSPAAVFNAGRCELKTILKQGGIFTLAGFSSKLALISRFVTQ